MHVDFAPWNVLSGEMLKTGKYNPRNLDGRSLMIDCLRGLTVVEWTRAGDRIVSHGVVEKTKLPDTWQIRKLFVTDEHRGNGNGSAAMENIVRRLLLIPVCESPVHFAFTDNARIVKVLRTFRFKTVTAATMPDVEQWAQVVGVYDRLPAALRGKPPDGRYLLIRR